MSSNTTERLHRRNARGAFSVLTILLLGLSVLAVTFASSAGSTASLDLVDVTIQTTQSLPYQYTLTAYNTSGYQVANYYGNFPEAAFALPSGTYLITASADLQQNYVCDVCLYAKSGAAMPIRFMPPYSEYGYAVEKVSGPVQVTIPTQNSTAAPLENVTIHVAFVNGTSAAGADVYGSVIGSSYGYSSNWTTYGQTGADGNTTLVLPAAPVQVTASISVPIQLPKSVSNVTVVVGGQKVNVTVYWQPSSVYLSGQALILPPQKGTSITLQAQQNNPYPIYYSQPGVPRLGVSYPQGGAYTTTTYAQSTTVGTAVGTVAGSNQAVASPQANRIPPFNPSSSQLSPSNSQAPAPAPATAFDLATLEMLAAVVAAAAVIGVGASLVLSRRKPRIESARL